MTSDGATNLVERIEIVSVEAVEDSVSNNVNRITFGFGIKFKQF